MVVGDEGKMCLQRENQKTLFRWATTIDFKARLGNLDRWSHRLNTGTLGLTQSLYHVLIGSLNFVGQAALAPHRETANYPKIEIHGP